MTKRRKTTAAAKADSEFSFADYEQPEADPFDDPLDWLDEEDPFAGLDERDRLAARRRKIVEIALLEDPFSTVIYEDLREDSELYNERREGAEPPLTSLDRFQRVSESLLRFSKLADPHRDRERDEIQLRIALYWLKQAQKEEAFK